MAGQPVPSPRVVFTTGDQGLSQATRVDTATDSYLLLQFDSNAGQYHALSATGDGWVESVLELRPQGQRLTVVADRGTPGSIESITTVSRTPSADRSRLFDARRLIGAAAVRASAPPASMQTTTTTTAAGHTIVVSTLHDGDGNVVETSTTESWKADGERHRDVQVIDGEGATIRHSSDVWDSGTRQIDGSTVYTHKAETLAKTDEGTVHTVERETTTVDANDRVTTAVDTTQDYDTGESFTANTTINGPDRETTGTVHYNDGSRVEITETWHGNTVTESSSAYDGQGQQLDKTDTTASTYSDASGIHEHSESARTTTAGESQTLTVDETRSPDGAYTKRWESSSTDANGDQTTTKGATLRDADDNESTAWVRTAPDGSTIESTTNYGSDGKGTDHVVEANSSGVTTSDTTKTVTKDDPPSTGLPPADGSDFPDASHPVPGQGLITDVGGEPEFPPEWGIAASSPATPASQWPNLTDLTGQAAIVDHQLGRVGWETGPSQPSYDWGLAANSGIGQAIRSRVVAASRHGWLTPSGIDASMATFRAEAVLGDESWWQPDITIPNDLVTTCEHVAAEIQRHRSADNLQASSRVNPPVRQRTPTS